MKISNSVNFIVFFLSFLELPTMTRIHLHLVENDTIQMNHRSEENVMIQMIHLPEENVTIPDLPDDPKDKDTIQIIRHQDKEKEIIKLQATILHLDEKVDGVIMTMLMNLSKSRKNLWMMIVTCPLREGYGIIPTRIFLPPGESKKNKIVTCLLPGLRKNMTMTTTTYLLPD